MKTILSFLFVLNFLHYFSQDSITDYYNEITSGTEYGNNKNKCKYTKDIKIYVYGEKNDTLLFELNNIVKELNDIIETVNIEIVSDSSKSNLDVYFGSSKYFLSKDSSKFMKKLISRSNGFFRLYEYNGKIIASNAYINTDEMKNMDHKKHVLREELTQCLGFGNDSTKYKDSIFYQYWNYITYYSEIDKKIIKMHYSN